MTIETINIKPLVIQEGRRHVMRYGGITGVITKCGSGFTDGMFQWFNDGRYYSDRENGRDLIAEYIPQPESLPFVLKAGDKYETVRPDGSAGPVVTLVDHTLKHQLHESYLKKFPFSLYIDCKIYFAMCDGLILSNKTDAEWSGCRIVREQPKPPTPIERLEAWRTEWVGKTYSMKDADLLVIIADLKAVKP
jgi:hypothetical protein